ncbi:MAG: hypothetical protein OXD49_11860 [Candidatus Poribacteria bacterium]|nr:hypothetical protein [Candidatus Poribacteria bacterium]
MREIAVFVACILFYASVAPIVASTSEIAEARIAGENDTKGFDWKRFTASYLTIHASPILLLSAIWFMDEFNLYGGPFDSDNVVLSCCAATYGISALTIVFALIHSPVPPADRFLGKSPEWVNAYTQAYQKSMKRSRVDASVAGCFAGTATLAATVYLIFSVTSGDTPGSN